MIRVTATIMLKGFLTTLRNSFFSLVFVSGCCTFRFFTFLLLPASSSALSPVRESRQAKRCFCTRFPHTFPYFENLYCYSSEKTVLCQSFLFRRQINSIKSPVCRHWFWLYCTKSFRPFFRVFFRFFFRIYYPTTFALSNAVVRQKDAADNPAMNHGPREFGFHTYGILSAARQTEI